MKFLPIERGEIKLLCLRVIGMQNLKALKEVAKLRVTFQEGNAYSLM